MSTLKQKRFFTKREYKIHENKLYFKTSYIGGEGESIISFENISKEKTTYKSKNVMILIISLILFLFSVVSFLLRGDKEVDPNMWLFWIFMSLTLMIIYITMRENSWKIRLYNNSWVYLFKTKPNQDSVNEFIALLFYERDNYLRETYLNLDTNLSYETQINDLKWLRNVEAISKEEFNNYYQDLKNLYAPKKGTIGFDKSILTNNDSMK